MKSSAILFLILTTCVLVLVTIFSALNFPFPLIFYMVCAGQLLLIWTVYKVLTEKYTTEKTFEDYYEDHPIDRE
ncbi:hypothetical protein [Christiangramia sp.]|uniref:hypothetical protein n=1 Tax=Christiangramia sp. TaxID=1931228 RepID=UPI0026115D21|nr:hypothetical protein [Christiangramia sp.]